MAFRVWPLLLLAACVLALHAAAAGGESARSQRDSRAAADAAAERTAPLAERRGRRRPGCGRFCRQAGGFGGGGPHKTYVLVRSQKIRVARDRIFGVRATCLLRRPCVGAILVDSPNPCCEPDNIANGVSRYGRADLRIPAHATRKVLVGITRRGFSYLKRHRRDPDAYTVVQLIQNKDDIVDVSPYLTMLAPR